MKELEGGRGQAGRRRTLTRSNLSLSLLLKVTALISVSRAMSSACHYSSQPSRICF